MIKIIFILFSFAIELLDRPIPLVYLLLYFLVFSLNTVIGL